MIHHFSKRIAYSPRTHDRLYFFGYDHTPARLALAEAAIEAAFRLHPDAGEAHLARAQNLYRGYLDYDAALAELEVAAKTLPNDASVFELKGYIERRQGKQEEAVHSLERAIDLDPRNSYHAAADCAQLSSSTPFRRAKIGFGTRAGYRSKQYRYQTRAREPWNSIGKLIPDRCIK